jgi:hypothetical protein
MDKTKMERSLICMVAGGFIASIFAFLASRLEFSSFGYEFAAIALSVVALAIVGLGEMGWKYVAAIVGFGFTLFIIEPLATVKGNIALAERVELAEKATQDWIAASCPVYKGECGSKAKYACEIKVATVGRYDLGDSFVQSYPTCAK